MTRFGRLFVPLFVTLGLITAGVTAVMAWTPLPVAQDPLVRMPGSQPAQAVSLESPNRCLNCHAGYNSAVEPGFNWAGSMMAQSARDPLWWAAMTVAGQDSIWALGTPNAVDLCERCHFPGGWLGGRSDPPNASAMSGADYDGVQCDFCHRMVDPFFAGTYAGTREGNDWLNYWDETNASGTPSGPAATATFNEDRTLALALRFFNGSPFYANNVPVSPAYTEATSGQFFVSPNSAKRASFADADARHQMYYSRYHKSKTFCATCHDVSNPVLANLGADPNLPLPSEQQSAYAYAHAERTYSEFVLSAYGQQGGAAGLGPFAPAVFDTSYPNNYIAKCQDCHMRDVVGAGANKRGVPVRPTDSVEHPNSGQPLHDLTGGNVWISTILASTVTGSPNYDATNAGLLRQGAATLTLDLDLGQGLNATALLAGADRAAQQLQLAAAIEDLSYDPATGALSFRIQNQTGHKLISGFPEGRRMFVNIRAYTGGALVYEINPYDASAGTLKGLSYPYQPGFGVPPPATLGAGEAYVDTLVYEVHPKSDLTGEDETFHFALATDRYKDNRIPPRGFRIDEASARLAQPVWHGVAALDYFTADEYAGGYDAIALTLPVAADAVEVNLYYQTTSREYIEFLRDEINGNPLNQTLPASAYVVQSDPFFSRIKAWGNVIWQLWRHNMSLPGAAPVLMTSANTGGGGGCAAPTPTLLSAVPGHTRVTLGWSNEHTGDPSVLGYKLYYDQADKLQFRADAGLAVSYVDSGLTNGQLYCYAVTSYTGACESGPSNVLCATPTNQGAVAVSGIVTGYYEGNGNNKTFVPSSSFRAGAKVYTRVTVTNVANGAPVANAVVTFAVTPGGATFSSGPSNGSGLAEGAWGTKKNTATGSYQITVTGVVVDGYTWNGVPVSTTVTITP